jgi:3-dehydroquinate synthetase
MENNKRNKVENDTSVRVQLGPERSYSVVFSNLSSLPNQILELPVLNGKVGSCVLVSNSVVGQTKHKETVMKSLLNAGWKCEYLEIPDGEALKTTETYINLCNQLLALRIDRKTLLIGLGGGVTTDIVGFAASTVLRGLTFVNLPTSLLAMVDASVGGKTGVNTIHGKNLLGSFWQPSLVLVSVKETLE